MPGPLMPLLHRMDPERAHGATIRLLSAGQALDLVPKADVPQSNRLRTDVLGLSFDNPLGLAAGFDKNAEVPAAMLRLGFGFVEVGTITPRPQSGNPRPRLFRLTKDEAVINRMGFNNAGAEAAARRLDRLRSRNRLAGPLGVNIGKNKDSEDAAGDYRTCARTLSRYADYLVINVSSPNTPGLRALQSRNELIRLVDATVEVRSDGAQGRPPPVLVKIAPDLASEDLVDLARAAEECDIAGFIVSNTTISRPPQLKDAQAAEIGGLSGRPLFDLSTSVLAEMSRLTNGRVPLIGVGGVASGEDAYRKIRAGASLVQMYSMLVYHGPALIERVVTELDTCLVADRISRLSEAVGRDSLG